MKKRFNIIHDDEAIVIVEKAAKVLTIPDRYQPNMIFNLYHELEKQFGKIFIVHRLDKETSGLLVFAKTEEAHKSLSAQFENRAVEKIYKVLVEGVMYGEDGVIDSPIGKHPSKPKMIITNKGKESLTHYKVVEKYRDYTLLDADIKTGRTHQIRVHFKSIGFPLAIDSLYGRNDSFYLSKVKRKYKTGKNEEERPLMSRTSLHAHRLVLDHPISGERLTYVSELPKDFNAVVKQLGKWGKA